VVLTRTFKILRFPWFFFLLTLLLAVVVSASAPPAGGCCGVCTVGRRTINQTISGGVAYDDTAIWAALNANVSVMLGNFTNMEIPCGAGYYAYAKANNGTLLCRAETGGGGEIYNGTFNSTSGGYVYNDTDWNITFNETRLNRTIDERTNSTWYYPTAYNVDAGTLDGGNLASLAYYDDDTLNVSEAAGANPLIVVVNFSGVAAFDWLLIRERYEGGAGHEIYVQIWNYPGSVWDSYYVVTDQEYQVQLPPVFVADSTEHISGGLVTMRFFHLQNGNINHNLFIDYVQLVDGFSTTTTIVHDSLAGRNNDDNHPQLLNRNGTRTLLKDWNVGNKSIYNISNVSTENLTTAYVDGNLIPYKNVTQRVGNATNYLHSVHSFYAYLNSLYSPNVYLTSLRAASTYIDVYGHLLPTTNRTQNLGDATSYWLGVHSAYGYFLSANIADSLTANNASISNLSASNATFLNVSSINATFKETTVSGNTHSRAYLADTQIIIDWTWTQVAYDAETMDAKNEYSTASYNFTARKAGYYDVKAQTHLESGWAWALQIQVNGAANTTSYILAATGDSPTPIVNLMSDHYYLYAGDNVNVWVYCYGLGGGTCTIYGTSPATYFEVVRAEA